jgi:hypothetical protein
MAQMVECLPSIYKALCSIPRIEKKKIHRNGSLLISDFKGKLYPSWSPNENKLVSWQSPASSPSKTCGLANRPECWLHYEWSEAEKS